MWARGDKLGDLQKSNYLYDVEGHDVKACQVSHALGLSSRTGIALNPRLCATNPNHMSVSITGRRFENFSRTRVPNHLMVSVVKCILF